MVAKVIVQMGVGILIIKQVQGLVSIQKQPIKTQHLKQTNKRVKFILALLGGHDSIVLEYVSDGMENGNDSLVSVNKYLKNLFMPI